MKKIAMFVIVSLISAGITLVAHDEECKASAPALEKLTLTGKVEKSEKKMGEKTVALYTLTDANGNTVKLPLCKDNPPKYNLDEFVGKNVKVEGEGSTRENKKTNKKEIVLKTITCIEEVNEEKEEEANP